MHNKRVYRLETASGLGVFKTHAVHDYMAKVRRTVDEPVSAFDPPVPYKDGINIDYNNVCGFESIEQLLNWFRHTECFEALDQYSIYVSLYEVSQEHVQHGGHQVMFPKYLARMVERSKPSDFAKNLMKSTNV